MRQSNGTVYRAFGLTISSDIVLPELIELNQLEEEPDVKIVYGELEAEWESLQVKKRYFVYANGTFYLNIKEVAIFSITGGSIITVSPMPGHCARKLRLYLLGSCMGVLLMQSGILPLHGSAVVIDEKAYAIVGESGAGKSTLAAELLHRGYSLLTDDVIAVTLDEESGKPMVIPAYPQQKLWEESVANLHINGSELEALYHEEARSKFAVPVRHQFADRPIPLAGIFELSKSESDEMSLTRLAGLEQLQTLFQHTYRNRYIPALGLMEWHFGTTTQIAENVEMFQLRRSTTGFKVGELGTMILNETMEGVSYS